MKQRWPFWKGWAEGVPGTAVTYTCPQVEAAALADVSEVDSSEQTPLLARHIVSFSLAHCTVKDCQP